MVWCQGSSTPADRPRPDTSSTNPNGSLRRMPQTQELTRRCAACGAVHTIFHSRPDYGGVAPSRDTERHRCRKCSEVLFEEDVRDGEFYGVYLEDDPYVAERRAAEANRAASETGIGARLRSWWNRR